VKGLIIKDPWIDLILDGYKTWEIRGSNTAHRGHTELIMSGSGMIYGCADLVDSFPMDLNMFKENRMKHCIDAERLTHYNQNWAWVFENNKRYHPLKPYKHPQGAVIWVNL
jgi:hypothetical protein